MHIWLSKPVYELLPYFYFAAGLAALLASVYLDYWYWPTVCLVAGGLLVTAGLALFLKRRDFRQNRRPPDVDELD